ncbi:MAG: hypothetical protein FJZ00_04565 [Candidatus Sericytochromatia bacterium]|uniref:TM2 domain-containing protein n=1 Tax=Candidatus Tanganyikabacteria bacterium TaxID=2961651 RepID=A0A938BMV5_9BACT|nr:hypothetical protein [Candidatus Tanganyikabacteria bacterium]
MNRTTALASILSASMVAVAAPAFAAEPARESVLLPAELSLAPADKFTLATSYNAPDIRLAKGGGDNKIPWLAALLNFFFGGAGYIYNGERMLLGLGLTAGAAGLTYAELLTSGTLSNTGSMLSPNPATSQFFWPIFGSVFVMNTVLALDAWQEAEDINNGGMRTSH